MREVVRELMQHDGSGKKRQARQGRIVCRQPRLEALLDKLVRGAKALLLYGVEIAWQGPPQCHQLSPAHGSLYPSVMIRLRGRLACFVQRQEFAEALEMIGLFGSVDAYGHPGAFDERRLNGPGGGQDTVCKECVDIDTHVVMVKGQLSRPRIA